MVKVSRKAPAVNVKRPCTSAMIGGIKLRGWTKSAKVYTLKIYPLYSIPVESMSISGESFMLSFV